MEYLEAAMHCRRATEVLRERKKGIGRERQREIASDRERER